MSYLLPHLRTGWAVDQAILNEEDRVVVIRFGHDYDPVCMQMDEALSKIVEKVKNFAVIYLVDITEVPDFNTMRARRVHPHKICVITVTRSCCHARKSKAGR